MTNTQHCDAAIFSGSDQPLRITPIEVPEPQPGEALLRVRCCTICGSDLHTIRGLRNEPTPTILGHEILGTVERLGDPALVDIHGQPLRLGQRVTWSTCVSCGQCQRCTGGLPQKCLHVVKFGHRVAEGREALSGGLAQFVLLPKGSSVVCLPDSLPDAVACPVNCATATIAAAFRAAGVSESGSMTGESKSMTGKRVLILGAGMLGLTAAAMANHHGASEVTVFDVDHGRAEMATRFGASCVLSSPEVLAQEKATDDIVFECSGANVAIQAGLDRAAIGGKVVLVGSVFKCDPIHVDPESVVRRCLTLTGVHNYAPVDLAAAVRFLESCSDRFPFGDLVAQTYPLARVNEAIAYALAQRPIRVAIHPWEKETDDEA